MNWLQSQAVAARFLASFAVFATVLLVCPPTPSSAQPQVGSAENPRDCKGVDFGQNVRDSAGGCCLPSQIDCGICFYSRSACEQQFGCFTSVRNLGCGCGNPAPVCFKCGYTKTACEQLLGCGTTATDQGCGCGGGTSCYGCDGIANSGKTDVGCGCGGGTSCYGCDGKANSGKTDVGCGCGQGRGCLEKPCSFNWGCQDPGTGCNPAYSNPSAYCPGNGTIPHNGTLYKITHRSHIRGTGYLWSTNPGGEQLSCFAHSISTYKCNNGSLVPN